MKGSLVPIFICAFILNVSIVLAAASIGRGRKNIGGGGCKHPCPPQILQGKGQGGSGEGVRLGLGPGPGTRPTAPVQPPLPLRQGSLSGTSVHCPPAPHPPWLPLHTSPSPQVGPASTAPIQQEWGPSWARLWGYQSPAAHPGVQHWRARGRGTYLPLPRSACSSGNCLPMPLDKPPGSHCPTTQPGWGPKSP